MMGILTGVLCTAAECRQWVGTPVPVEGQRLFWARRADLDSFAMPPADVPLLPTVRAAMVAAERCDRAHFDRPLLCAAAADHASCYGCPPKGVDKPCHLLRHHSAICANVRLV